MWRGACVMGSRGGGSGCDESAREAKASVTVSSRRLAFAAVGFIYGPVMALWGALASGGGHFNLLAMSFVAPYGVGLLFWPLWAYIVAAPPTRWMTIALGVTMAAHYLGLLHYIFLTDNSDSYWFANGARQQGFVLIVAATLALYVLGHLFLWSRFIIVRARSGPSPI